MADLLKRGSTGPDVRAVQDVLNFHIRRLQPLEVDGKYGPLTEARVREFQRVNALSPDGQVGPNTRAVLFAATTGSFRLGLQYLGDQPLDVRDSRPGIRPPQLIPPLVWPGPGPAPLPWPVPLPTPSLFPQPPIVIFPDSRSFIPPWAPKGTVVINLNFVIPLRSDPADPKAVARKLAVDLINKMTDKNGVRAFLLDLIPKETKITPPSGGGFNWGVDPLFNHLLSGKTGLKGHAKYSVLLTGPSPILPTISVDVGGDASAEVDLSKWNGRTWPTTVLQWQAGIHLSGTF